MLFDVVFLVVADEAAGRSVPFVFLERVREDFMQQYGSSIDEEGQHPLADDADEDDFLFEDRFSIAYNLDREFGYGIVVRFRSYILVLCAMKEVCHRCLCFVGVARG